MTLQFWTNFADGAVMFPLGIAIGLTLCLLRQRRAAFAWAVGIGCVWGLMLILKLAGYMIEGLDPASPLSAIDLVTPSGHVASASAIYGGLVGLLLLQRRVLMPHTLLATAGIAAAIGITRVELGEHSVSEVLIGAAVGMLGVYWMSRLLGGSLDRRARLPLLVVAVLVVAVRYGEHLDWEQAIHQLAVGAIGRWRGIA